VWDAPVEFLSVHSVRHLRGKRYKGEMSTNKKIINAYGKSNFLTQFKFLNIPN
jgi:hypothetical protein